MKKGNTSSNRKLDEVSSIGSSDSDSDSSSNSHTAKRSTSNNSAKSKAITKSKKVAANAKASTARSKRQPPKPTIPVTEITVNMPSIGQQTREATRQKELVVSKPAAKMS